MRSLPFIVSICALVAAVIAPLSGTPEPLPALAMDSTLLFHAERSLALFGVLLAFVVVLAKAFQGELPVSISASGLRYSEAAAGVGGEVARLDRRVSELAESDADVRAKILELREALERRSQSDPGVH